MAKEIILTQEELEENCLLESGIINAMLWHDGQLRKGTNHCSSFRSYEHFTSNGSGQKIDDCRCASRYC